MPDAPTPPPQSPAPATDIVVRPLGVQHLSETARLHIQYLGAGLFPRLGGRFVRRWHQTFIDSPHACGFIATDPGGAVLGFLIGSIDQRKYVAHTLQTAKWPLALRGAGALAVRPWLAVAFVRTRLLSYLRRMSHPQRTTDHSSTPTAVVHAIVTGPASRGRGIGRLLLSCYEDEVVAGGTTFLELVTDEGPHGAGDFYRRVGWVEGQAQANKDGRRMLTFTRTIAR